jgi:Restriction endonuclease EcoRV
VIKAMADKNGFAFEKAKQNQYPEFTLFDRNHPNEKIAIDIKSTYRQFDSSGKLKPYGFTLGSYRSYLRDPAGKKGILYPYSEYAVHWVIGFLYTRNLDNRLTEIRQIIEAAQLQPPFTDIEFFVQEKHKIAGRKAGSGNTTNIGSIRSNLMSDFAEGSKGFSSKLDFEEYWKHY